MNKPKIIGLGSCRAVGKDTFFSLLKELNPHFSRWAFADALKDGLEDICNTIFDKKINELTKEEKEIFRPIMVSAGKAGREINKDFWVNKVAQQIDLAFKVSPGVIPVITDVRYTSEFKRFKQIYGDDFLFVNIDRIGAPDPTDEERIHAPELKKLADVDFTWNTDESFITLRPQISYFYDKFFLGID